MAHAMVFQTSLVGIMDGWLLILEAGPISARAASSCSGNRRDSLLGTGLHNRRKRYDVAESLAQRVHVYVAGSCVRNISACDRSALVESAATEHSRSAAIRHRVSGLHHQLCHLLFKNACRRLSLVFERVFLVGFPTALPFSLLGKRLSNSCSRGTTLKILLTALAFAAFYWSAVAILFLRVR